MSYGALAKMAEPCGQSGMLGMTTLKERLNNAVVHAEERLAGAKEAREIFNRNPDIERLLDIMQRGLF